MAQKTNTDDLIGQEFGRLTIIGIDRVEPRIIKTTGKQNGWIYYVVCKCSCGNECIVNYTDLKRKHTMSCGCLQSEETIKRNKIIFSTANGETVGEYKRLYGIYRGMRARCFKKNVKEYKYYGARGITIEDCWLGAEGYDNFKQWSLTHGYSDILEIDRIDNNKNYSPDNCRWADRKSQMRNTRMNLMLKYKGEIKPLSQWCEELGLEYSRTLARIDLGYSVEEAFSAKKHQVLHVSDAIKHRIVLDNYIFHSIKECCEEYLHQTTGSFSNYLSGQKHMPKKWQDRGLRTYDESTDKDLKYWKE